MGLTNWTTLNRDYYTPFWDQIIASNHYDEIIRNLGYRFVLNSSSVTASGSSFDIDINLENVGFSRPFKQREVYLVFKNTETNAISTQLIDTDIRTWESVVTITKSFDLAETGTFQLYLWAPDKEPGLSGNPDYSIQFANTGTWESTTGYNDLLQTITTTTLGVDNFLLDTDVFVHPNPSSDFISIQVRGAKKYKIHIYNVKGQLIKEQEIVNNEKIAISELSNGIYYVRLNNNKSSVYKFIKD